MGIDAKTVAELRRQTGAGMMACKTALKETDGDIEKAVDHLRKQGVALADKKSGRSTNNGWIGHYVHHNGRVGVLIELKCETDFVAKGEDFQALIKDLAMQVATTSPVAVRREEICEELVAKEREIFEAQVPPGKPPEIVQKIVDGKIASYYKERCLLEQPFIKDDKTSVKDHITTVIQKTGENISVGRFERLELGSV